MADYIYLKDIMQLVERHIKVNNPIIKELCRKSKELYNQALYYLRQSLFGNIARKVLGDEFLTDSRVGFTQYKINIL